MLRYRPPHFTVLDVRIYLDRNLFLYLTLGQKVSDVLIKQKIWQQVLLLEESVITDICLWSKGGFPFQVHGTQQGPGFSSRSALWPAFDLWEVIRGEHIVRVQPSVDRQAYTCSLISWPRPYNCSYFYLGLSLPDNYHIKHSKNIFTDFQKKRQAEN